MKKTLQGIKYIRLLLILTIAVNNPVTAQESTETFSSYYNIIEPVTLQLSKVPHGDITWQESDDEGASWTSIPGANEAILEYSQGKSVLLRSLVLSGTCDTVLSQLVDLTSLKLETVAVENITSNSATVRCALEKETVSFKELGILYSTSQALSIDNQKVNSELPVDGPYSLDIENLDDEQTYYVRAYGKTDDDKLIYANILSFEPIKISIGEHLNIFTDTAQVKYSISGLKSEELDEHGILVNTVSGSPETAETVPGEVLGNGYHAIAKGLTPGADYYLTAYLSANGVSYYSEEKKITTWTDYNGPVNTDPFTIAHKIIWDNPSTAKRISQQGTYGDYGRIERIGNTDTLLLSYHGGPNNGDWINIYLRKSYDNGDTWEEQETVMSLADHAEDYWRFCNPELLFMKNGWIMLAYEANARPDENQSSVQILISKDSAQTWEEPIKYITGRSWEPSMLQLPNGEIELFYSCEADWWPSGDVFQDIRVIRSTDNGSTWSEPETVAYYPEKRDGMPVPVQLQGNKGVVFAIECVNVGDSPFIIHRDMDSPWQLTTSDFNNSPHRWLIEGFAGHGGAPYMLQLPSGETVLSTHIYRGGDWHQNNYQQVMIGDNAAKTFENPQNPWDNLVWGEGAVNNSLFLKNDTCIVSVSARMFDNGTGAVYWLEGQIVPK